MPRCRGQSGQVLPFVVLVLAFAAAAALWLGRLGGAAAARAKASATADMSALAGAGGDRRLAAAVAARNGGRVVRFEQVDGDVRVGVVIGPAVAEAVARPGGVGAGAGAGAGGEGLAPALRAALARAEQLLGMRVPITSARRSRAEQAALWARRFRNRFPVARPGTSKHELGLAVDVPSSFVPVLLRVARQAGLCRPYPLADPVHFELCPP